MKEIDFEKDYLVIHRHMDGKFWYFRWYSAADRTLEEMQEIIKAHNEKQTDRTDGEEGRPAELVTDKLVREICAYRDGISPYEDVLNSAQRTIDAVEKAKDALREAMDSLEDVKL